MKVAITDGETIIIQEHTYERIPDWRTLSAQGKLRCPRCAQPLRLLAGISVDPHFVHVSASDCHGLSPEEVPVPAVVSEAKQETAAASEVRIGSFRLPKSRAITSQDEQMQTPAKPQEFRERLTPRFAIPAWSRDEEESLHPHQLRAVHKTDGPLLILAGAGSGKTRVMTERTSHLIAEKGVDPRHIMVVTFTTKAAEELKVRLAARLSRQQAASLVTGTFHSIFYRMLQHHRPQQWDQKKLLKQNWQKRRLLQESGLLQHTELSFQKESEFDEALDLVSRWKNESLSPSQAAALAPDSEEIRRAQLLFPLYEEAKRRSGWFDFDDMLSGCYQLLTEDPDVLRRYQERIHYLMIDEFQDINRIQYETIKLLAAPQNNLCVVGDDDQSIYGFRGSDPQYILGFTKDYPAAETITLEVNFRSRSSIVSLGYSLIGNNRSRWKKDIKSFHPEEGDTYLFYPADEEEQASRIVDEICVQKEKGASLRQFAILLRTNESARPILERMMEANLPFRFVQEEEPFYEKQAVRWALNYLKLALNRDDASAMREILSTLYLSQEQWNVLRSQSILDDAPLVDVLPRLPHLKGYQRSHLQKIADLLKDLPGCTPAQALELIFEDGKLREYVKKRNKEKSGPAKNRASDELQQLLVTARRHATLPEFLAHIEEMNQKEKAWRKLAPTLDDSVQILSIHRAKGLEFDTVFLPDLVEGALPHEYALDESRKGNSLALEEERRLMYVAITRAKRQLCIGIPQNRFSRKTRVSRFISEMGR
ncbi:UvrD-helicase domain-containing protein [Brevibacillus migulae]|uniref:UvrD-helicase domain-containing protein n=1 Tax=Brevibacillus migulae TaxID=1644114 RepID=UPI00106E7DD7|nr:UvrD-helicase domain-containing protein [Brevibacillus migulae]